MPNFGDIKAQALKAKDSATGKFNSTKDRFQVSTSELDSPQGMSWPDSGRLVQNNPPKNAEPRTKLPPPPPPPLRSNPSPSNSGRSQPDLNGPPPPIVRRTRPDAPSRTPSPSVSAKTSKPPTPGPPPPPTRQFNTTPKRTPHSQPSVDAIDWANLSPEDKQTFFTWLDEFFIKFTGDDSFIPKDQRRKSVPAMSSVKNAAGGVAGHKGQGPPVSRVRRLLAQSFATFWKR